MASRPVDELYNEASRSWPKVSWSADAYASHLDDPPPRHAVDVFLAGAAGHRVDEAWGVIQEELGPNVCRILERQPKADYEVEDLWSDALVRMMSDDQDAPPLAGGAKPAKIVRYRGEIKLLNYLVTVAKRLAIGRQRQLQSRGPTASLQQTTDGEERDLAGQFPDADAPAPDAAALEQESIDLMLRTLAGAIATLSPEQRFLLRMVYGQGDEGMKQKEAGALLGWSEFKTSRQLTDARTRLQESLEGLSSIEWTPALREAWEACWQKAWEAVQEGQGQASERAIDGPAHGAAV